MAATLLVCTGAWAQASDTTGPSVSFKGFGTLGLAHATVENADLLSRPHAAEGTGHTDEWSAKVDSRLGAQLDLRVNSQFSGQLQVISEQRSDGSFRPDVEWANIKYQPNSSISVQVGRQVLASFLVSDYRLVGYANHWVRPPIEVYNLIPITNSDGISMRLRQRFDEVTNTTQLSYGQAEWTASSGFKLEAKKGWGINNKTEFGDLTFNLAYQWAEVSFNIPELQQFYSIYRSLPDPAGAALADRYDPDRKTIRFGGIGASYDPGHWFVMGEWGRLDTNFALSQRQAWYVSSGFRSGAWTPYVIYSRSDKRGPTSDPGVPMAGPVMNAILNQILAYSTEQQTLTAGVRWDAAPNLAFKMQFDHVDLARGSYGELANIQPGFVPGGSHNVVTFVLDFLF